ncbi:MAG: GAF domain-containing protein [Chloroflexota bacterium]
MSQFQTVPNVLLRIERLKVLRDLGFLSHDKVTIFDRLAQLASDVIGAPVSLVSMVAADYQFFKSQVGLPEPWASKRSTPLSHSLCQHVVATNTPLIIDDARQVDFLQTNRAIPDLNVIGYLGIPLTLSDGNSLGSFCVIDNKPRRWSELEVSIMAELAEIITQDIDLRAMARLNRGHQQTLEQFEAQLEKLLDQTDTSLAHADFLTQVRTLRRTLNV